MRLFPGTTAFHLLDPLPEAGSHCRCFSRGTIHTSRRSPGLHPEPGGPGSAADDPRDGDEEEEEEDDEEEDGAGAKKPTGRMRFVHKYPYLLYLQLGLIPLFKFPKHQMEFCPLILPTPSPSTRRHTV
ncbi:hypothetical protein PAPYR_10486 [Paratrimastix pyriformis]|uniref:Uncharacterized protein n=1 Tax=Paratrimastix pyriformis TaxID=342808 RepID=A0ABQ8UA17_9EUKA|nr:hypothetical protein PAPYR_10486 [Paratrimastix pyriformis]